jgi:hypothetical protein
MHALFGSEVQFSYFAKMHPISSLSSAAQDAGYDEICADPQLSPNTTL